MGLVLHQQQRVDWFLPAVIVLLSIGAGMILMYWITDWGTHGYVCSGEKVVICQKEL